MNLAGIPLQMLSLWALFGVVVSIIIHFSGHTHTRGGLVLSLILGIIGALLGGILAVIAVGIKYAAFRVVGFLLAVIGGVVISILSHIVLRQKHYIKTITILKNHTD